MLPVCAVAAPNEEMLRPWTARDSVAVRYVSTDQELTDAINSPAKDAVVFSQDGRYFFFISHHGDIDSDSNI
jgi:hypothetical protein